MDSQEAERGRSGSGSPALLTEPYLIAAYHRFNDILAEAITWLAIVILSLVVLVLILGAATRYTTGMGYDWVLDMPPRVMPWMVFPMIGVLLRKDRHITVDVLPTLLTGRRLTMLRMVGLAASLLATVAFVFAGADAVQFFRQLNEMSSTEIEYPVWYLYLSFPVGFALAANFCFDALLREFAIWRAAGAQSEA